MDEEEREEPERGVQVVQLRWPLSPLAPLLDTEAQREVLESLRCLACPSFAVTDVKDLTWVVYHRPVLACFDRVLSALLPCPPHTSYKRVFAGHALLGAVFERLFGPALGRRYTAVLDARSRRLLGEYAARETTAAEDRALREMSVGMIVELVYDLPHVVPIAEPKAKLSFLRYFLALLRVKDQAFPDRAPYLELFAAIRDAIEPGGDDRFPDLIRRIERLIYTNQAAPAYPSRGRLYEARLENKPRVQAAAKKLEASLSDGQILAVSGESNGAENSAIAPIVSAGEPLAIPTHIGPYLIRDPLGFGGMGTVHSALGPGQRAMALKVLNREQSFKVDDLVRFGREVEIALRLHHPHIVRTLDHGVAEGYAFLAMELLPGGSLEDRLRQGAVLGEDETWSLVRQIASALDYSWNHPKKYMHRDIKAENILFDRFGRPKLTDFGLATGTSGDATRYTATGDVFGTPRYMAPEMHIDQRAVDIRADLWALGVLAWRCLTGRFPFDDVAAPSLYLRVSSEEAEGRPPAASRPLFDRLLAHEPADRFASPRALIEAIEARALPEDVRSAGESGEGSVPLALEWRAGYRLFVFLGDELRFGRSSGEDQDLCLRVLPAVQFAELTTCISGRHGCFSFEGSRCLVRHQGANGLRKNGRPIPRDVPEWLDFGDRLCVGGVLDLEVWPQVAGALFTRPKNHSRHSYLLLAREYDLSFKAPCPAWPKLNARLIARRGALFLADSQGGTHRLRPGQSHELDGQALRVSSVSKAMFK